MLKAGGKPTSSTMIPRNVCPKLQLLDDRNCDALLRRVPCGNVRASSRDLPMTAPKALIADNEPLLRAEFRERLRELWPDLDICAEAANGTEALRAWRRYRPDVMFLDV